MSFARMSLAAIARGAIALGTVASAGATPTMLTITMKALNGSKEDGTATLTQVDAGVKVVIALKNAKGDDQPTHIHIGTCAKINKAPEYGLPDTINGANSTVVKGITIATLLAGHYALNVHKSSKDLATYVSCGDIK